MSSAGRGNRSNTHVQDPRQGPLTGIHSMYLITPLPRGRPRSLCDGDTNVSAVGLDYSLQVITGKHLPGNVKIMQ